MANFEMKMSKMLGVEKITGLDKFSLFGGSIGLIVDLGAIVGLARGLIFPNIAQASVSDNVAEGSLLVTAILGFYSLTLLIWFLVRFERAKRQEDLDVDFRAFDEFRNEILWGGYLLPILGTFGMMSLKSTQVQYFLSIFVSFLPVTLWIFALSTSPWLSLGMGVLGSAFMSQYATFFALILDKFFY